MSVNRTAFRLRGKRIAGRCRNFDPTPDLSTPAATMNNDDDNDDYDDYDDDDVCVLHKLFSQVKLSSPTRTSMLYAMIS
jgi:hypothetical protein